MNNLVLLTEVYETSGEFKYTKLSKYSKVEKEPKYSIRNIYLNPSHVTLIKQDEAAKERLLKGDFPEGLDNRQEFTKIQVGCNSSYGALNITVIGSVGTVAEKLNGA
tara:strand:- start:141 stop:461 length:321 start_codon:yes stop_codon:yes gene_type:complete